MEISSFSAGLAAIEGVPPDAGITTGTLLYALHPQTNGVTAVFEVSHVEGERNTCMAELTEGAEGFTDDIGLVSLKVITRDAYMRSPETYAKGPLYPKRPSRWALFSPYSDRNASVSFLGGAGVQTYSESALVTSSREVSSAVVTSCSVMSYLPVLGGVMPRSASFSDRASVSGLNGTLPETCRRDPNERDGGA